MFEKEKSEKTYKGTVVLTYGRSMMSLSAAASLRRYGVRVIGCDDVEMTVLNFSKHVDECFVYEPCEDGEEAYLSSLKEQLIKHKPDDGKPYILMPMFRDAKILARYESYFKGVIDAVAVPDVQSISQISPKDVFAKKCQEHDLKIPKTIDPSSLEDAERAAQEIGFPVLIKPVDERGGRGIHKIKDMEELRLRAEESKHQYGRYPLVQELIDGEDYCVAVLCDQGDVISHMAYKNLYQFPKDSGAGSMRETIPDTPFIETVRALMKAINWHGVAEIDFRWNGDEGEQGYLIEVNARFWAGLHHSIESGVDFPVQLYQLFAEGRVTYPSNVVIGHKTKIPGLWTVSAIQEIAEEATHFDEFKKAWADICDVNNDAPLSQRLRQFLTATEKSVDLKEVKENINNISKLSKESNNELDVDDPFVGLGSLFVLSSLIKHGKLPPEVKM